MGTAATLNTMFEAMLEALGPSHWWPGDTPFEIAVGAILTQNTNWQNVEKAIANLKDADLLSPEAMYGLPPGELAELIRPAGYFNIKTKRLRNFLGFLGEEAGFDIESLKVFTLERAAPQGAGYQRRGAGDGGLDPPSTALEFPTFVVDAYTLPHDAQARAGLGRHGLSRTPGTFHGRIARRCGTLQ